MAKEKEINKITDALSALQEANNTDLAALAAAEKHFKAVSAGLSSSEDGEDATLAGQIMACKNNISKAETEAKQVQTFPGHLKAGIPNPLELLHFQDLVVIAT